VTREEFRLIGAIGGAPIALRTVLFAPLLNKAANERADAVPIIPLDFVEEDQVVQVGAARLAATVECEAALVAAKLCRTPLRLEGRPTLTAHPWT
jgi:hypothetical protein